MVTNKYTIEILEHEDGRSPYRTWFGGLKDKTAQARVDARLARVRDGNLGDHRALGGGIFEFRFSFGAGHRIYFARERSTIILLLAGGDKSSQSEDIATARKLYAEFSGEKMARKKPYRGELIERIRNDPEYGSLYVNAALEEGAGAFLVALKDVVDARGGASHLARAVEAHRVSIHKMLSDKGNPSFKNVDEILAAVGLRFTVQTRGERTAG